MGRQLTWIGELLGGNRRVRLLTFYSLHLHVNRRHKVNIRVPFFSSEKTYQVFTVFKYFVLSHLDNNVHPVSSVCGTKKTEKRVVVFCLFVFYLSEYKFRTYGTGFFPLFCLSPFEFSTTIFLVGVWLIKVKKKKKKKQQH